MYTNANSLGNKRDELQCRIDQQKPDVIGITEVWQKELFPLDGYHPAFRKDRAEDEVGGGVLLFVWDTMEVIECPELNASTFGESVWCIVKPTKAKRILIGVCYRSPNSTKENNVKLVQLNSRHTASSSIKSSDHGRL